MRRKKLITLLVIVILCIIISLIIWIITKEKEYKPKIIEPEVFEDEVFDTDMILGLWQDGTVFYRYNDDYTGITWDTADDITELEGSAFTWEVNKKRFTHYYQMEISNAIIPKTYTITKLDLSNLEYKDDYNVEHIFTKLE